MLPLPTRLFLVVGLLPALASSLVVDVPCCKVYQHMNAYFGLDLEGQTYTAPLVDLDDVHGCRPNYRPDLNGSIALIARGPRGDSGCTFAIKAMNAQLSNAGGVVVFNNEGDDLLPMPENYAYPIIIPAIFIGESDGLALWKQLQAKERVVVSINGTGQVQPQELNNDLTRILFISICAIWCLIFVCYIISYIQKCCKVNERQRDFQNLETKSYRPLEDPVDSDGNAADESGSALEEGGGEFQARQVCVWNGELCNLLGRF